MLRAGDVARIDGLVAKPHLNGRIGRISQWDDEKGRWHVEVADMKTSDVETIALKPANLFAVQAASDGGKDDDDGVVGDGDGEDEEEEVEESRPRAHAATIMEEEEGGCHTAAAILIMLVAAVAAGGRPVQQCPQECQAT